MEKMKYRIADTLLSIFAFDGPQRKFLSDPALILEGAGVESGQTALEVGCGRGYFTVPLAQILGDTGCLLSLDVTQASVDYVTEKVAAAGLSNVEVFKANALDSGVADQEIDLVLLFGVIPSPTLPLSRLLPEMHRVLKPGGRLAVWTAVPGWSSQSIVASGLFKYLDKVNNCHTFERSDD